jgi:transcription elongation factor Elf1
MKEKYEMICKVCGRYFRAKKEDKYEVTVVPEGLRVLTEQTKTYECFDCPKCGCQNIVNIKEVDDSGNRSAD